jgi:hypothetical protein
VFPIAFVHVNSKIWFADGSCLPLALSMSTKNLFYK